MKGNVKVTPITPSVKAFHFIAVKHGNYINKRGWKQTPVETEAGISRLS